ncbi:unnamed protein product [Pleuronectes platessa]|uniref:Uncharacterized protein n=1 Tax=Pleuronectes platessa TaxID=8262 RepID=A0A9N7TU57_PLEPL|nr:unnamed protein product [Pleuronectes platessa]
MKGNKGDGEKKSCCPFTLAQDIDLLCWGNGELGQTGCGRPGEIAPEEAHLREFTSDRLGTVKLLACGSSHSIVVTEFRASITVVGGDTLSFYFMRCTLELSQGHHVACRFALRPGKHPVQLCFFRPRLGVGGYKEVLANTLLRLFQLLGLAETHSDTDSADVSDPRQGKR